MKILAVFLLLGLVVIGVLWYKSGGSIEAGAGFGGYLASAFGFAKSGGQAAVDAGRPALNELVAQPWFVGVLLSSALAYGLIRFWRQLSTGGKIGICVVIAVLCTVVTLNYR